MRTYYHISLVVQLWWPKWHLIVLVCSWGISRGEHKPELYKRYIDYVPGASSGTLQHLEEFKHFCSTYHSSLKYTNETNKSSIPLLDLCPSISDDKITTSIHYQPTDTQRAPLIIVRPILVIARTPYHWVNFSVCKEFLHVRETVTLWANPKKWKETISSWVVVSLPPGENERNGLAMKEHSGTLNDMTGPKPSRKCLYRSHGPKEPLEVHNKIFLKNSVPYSDRWRLYKRLF